MAGKYSNILNPLQEYELTPPAGAFEKAWEKILLQQEGLDSSEDATKNAFQKLQGYHMEAPELDFKTLLTGDKKSVERKQAKLISVNLLKVAAVMAIAVTGALVYVAISKQKSSDTGSGQYAGAQQAGRQDNRSADGNTLLDSVQHTSAVAATDLHPSVSQKSGTVQKRTRQKGRVPLGDQGSFYNNDLFFTLVNYKEYGKEKLFTKALKDKRVTLNQYSYVNLSDKMVAMLQEVYLTKKNGKLARKAKKAKKKFEKWKKKDEKYFDKELDKNPVDIIDLGEFLMKN